MSYPQAVWGPLSTDSYPLALGYLVRGLGSGRCVLMTGRRRRGREAGR